MSEKWEYMTEFAWANLEGSGVEEFLKKRYPTYKPAKYAAETLMPRMNEWGRQGWELIHMEPIAGVGQNGDVRFAHGGGYALSTWSNVYFCVYKRRIKDGNLREYPGTG